MENETEINILDGKRSLNANIFLKQFRMTHPEIVQLVRDGRSEVFGAERLRGLLKLLPSQEEIDAIKGFDGDQEKLGDAEKFFVEMMKLPNYRMRIEGLLIMEEFNANMEWIRPSVEAVIQASKDIQENKSLKELIFLILMSGNYLNSGNYAGNAAGFKLSSLLKLTEIRANKPRMNLLHYVAQEAKEKNPKLLDFPEEMKFLKDASQVSVDTLTQDINNIANKVKAITEQIVVAGMDFQKQMESFLKDANIEVVELEEDLKDIQMMRSELATFFAEDERTFKLEECFRILQTFCERFQKAIGENVQRDVQEEKLKKRRKIQEQENTKRNSKDLSDSQDESMDQSSTSQEDEDGSIVDMLLADVRSGFTSRKFNDGNFSVQKVTKVNLLDALSTGTGVVSTPTPPESPVPQEGNLPPSFVRGGYGRVSQRKKQLPSSSGESPVSSPTPESALNQRRSRRSYATEDNESLIDFLMESEKSAQTEQPRPEMAFERYGSLRRRHQERKDKRRGGMEVIGRELAPSPIIPESPNETLNTTTESSASSSSSRSDNGDSDSKHGRILRRTRSLLDRPSVDKANAEHRRLAESKSNPKDELDSSDALLDRIKQKLHRKSEDRQARLAADDRLSGHGVSREEDSSRTSSRWRSGISVPENSLETISERSQAGYDRVNYRDSINSSRDAQKLKYRKSLDPSEFSRLHQNQDVSSTRPLRTQDDSDMHSPSVAVSVRKQISSGIGTNIDQVLKKIEDSGRTIDTVGVSGPIKRTPEVSEAPKPELQQPMPQPQQQVAVVAHMTASYNRPVAPVDIAEQELKAKRDKRKKRSTLTLEDVRAAMKSDAPNTPSSSSSSLDYDHNSKPNKPESNIDNVVASMNERNSQSTIYYQQETGKPVAKTPPSPRRPSSDADNNIKNIKENNAKELSKAAKLAAKKKFRDARFGDSSNSDKDRAKSNVEADGVNQALKEMANQTPMSRSKSFDEKEAKNGESEFSSNDIMRNGGNTSEEKRAVMRNSTSRLSLDGRRNGLYIPSDESDTELTPEDAGTQRLSLGSKPDRPQSVSQLSLKSTNTSTETLEADIESSPEQRRKNSPGSTIQSSSTTTHSSQNKPSTLLSQGSQDTPTNFMGVPMAPRPQSTTAIDLEESSLRRSYSLMERTKLHNDEDDNDNPLAKMAKWRLNRNRRRRSFYDNLPEVDSTASSMAPSSNNNNNNNSNNNSNNNNKMVLSPSSSLSPESLHHLHPFRTEVSELKNEVGSRSSYASSYASSNERDEGFETGSGTASQRTSMSSTIDSDIYAAASAAVAASSTATGTSSTSSSLTRRGNDCLRPKSQVDKVNSSGDESVIKQLPDADPVISGLSVEADRKERTESWTEQTVRANSRSGITKEPSCDSNSDFSALSPDSGHGTSKEEIWPQAVSKKPEAKDPKKNESTSSTHGAKTSVTKTKSAPNYMKSTSSSSSSAQKSARAGTKTPTPGAHHPPTSSVSPLKRDTPQRISFKEKESAPTLKRDISSRASMRAEPASSGFQRGTVARKSVRGPRTSLGLTTSPTQKTTATSVSSSPAGATTRPRTDSTASISSTTSSASNISAAASTPSSARRLSTPKARPTTPLSHTSPSTPSVTMRSKTPVNKTTTPTSTNRNSGTLSRTQSLRVSSSSARSRSVEPTKKSVGHTLSESTSTTTPRRSMTPLSHELKRSTTPLPHDQSRSTTPLPERPKSTTPMSEGSRSSTRARSSFMAPTASSKARKDTSGSASDLRSAKTSATPKSSGPLLRTASLRLPKKTEVVSPRSSLGDLSAGRKSPATVESPLQHKGEHYQSLSTVAEQDEEAAASSSKTSEGEKKSLLKRIGISGRSKILTTATASSASKAKPKAAPSTPSAATKKR